MKDIELPPLLKPDFTHSRPPQFYKDDWLHTNYWGKQSLEAYARAAVEADRDQRVPEGWKLVPVEPTDRMLNAASLATESEGMVTTPWLRKTIYFAMLASAPAPAQQEPSEQAELSAIALRFVDRAGDPHPGIDDAVTICAEFHAAVSAVVDKYHPLPMCPAQRQESPQQERKPMTDAPTEVEKLMDAAGLCRRCAEPTDTRG